MAIDFKKTRLLAAAEIWRGKCKILPGGFKPVQNFPVGTVLHRGTPIYVDFEAMSAAVCKTAKVLKGGTTTAPRVAKGHYFVAGDVVMKLGVTDKSPIIKSIDTANAGYDVITFASAIAGLAEGNMLVEATRICRNRRRFGFRPHPCRASLYTQHGCRSGQGVHRKGPPDD